MVQDAIRTAGELAAGSGTCDARECVEAVEEALDRVALPGCLGDAAELASCAEQILESAPDALGTSVCNARAAEEDLSDCVQEAIAHLAPPPIIGGPDPTPELAVGSPVEGDPPAFAVGDPEPQTMIDPTCERVQEDALPPNWNTHCPRELWDQHTEQLWDAWDTAAAFCPGEEGTEVRATCYEALCPTKAEDGSCYMGYPAGDNFDMDAENELATAMAVDTAWTYAKAPQGAPQDLIASANLEGSAPVIAVQVPAAARGGSRSGSASVLLASQDVVPIGETVELPILEQTELVDGAATVEMRLSDAVRRAALANDGWLNLILVVTDGERLYQQDFVRRVAVAGGNELAFLDKNLGVPAIVDVELPAPAASTTAADAEVPVDVSDVVAPVDGLLQACKEQSRRNLDGKMVTVGDLSVPGGASGKFDYGVTGDAVQMIDVVVKSDDPDVGAGVSGERAIGAISYAYRNFSANERSKVDGEFRFQEVVRDCYCGRPHDPREETRTVATPKRWNAVLAKSGGVAPTCNRHSQWARRYGWGGVGSTSTHTVRWKAAFNILGISAGAENKNGTAVGRHWTFDKSTNRYDHWLCGNGEVPLESKRVTVPPAGYAGYEGPQ